MKFTLFAGIAAAALTARTLEDVQNALSSISQATQQLQSGINSFNGAGQVTALTTASQNVIDKTNAATQTVSNSAALSNEDALKLPPPVQSLGSLVQDTVNALISKKPLFAQLGVCSVVEMQATQIRDAAANFSKTLLSKIPMALQTIGQGLAAPITNNLDKAVAAFQSCPGASSGGSGPTSSSSSSGSAPTSSGAAPTSSGAVTTSSGAAPTSSGAAPTSSAVAPTSSSGAGSGSSGSGSGSGSGASSAPVPAYTGAASNNAAGFGAAALAAVAVLAF